jgi:hypothetical protein
MEPVYWIDFFSIPFLFVFTVFLVVGAILIGQLLGSYMKKRSGGGETIGSVVGATLGFLAFLLAFTFNMAANRFDNRKNLMMEELNVINTAYHRAGLLEAPYSAHGKTLLREYVDLRVLLAKDMNKADDVVRRSEEILQTLWQDIEVLTTEQVLTIRENSYIQSITDLMNSFEKRVIVALHFRIPGAIWMGLYVLAILAMIVVGYQFGQSKQRQWLVSLLLAAAFSFIIVLIADLDRSSEGSIIVNQQPVIEFQKKMETR